MVWVLTPKSGRDGYVAPNEIQVAAPTAGLHATSSAGVSEDFGLAHAYAHARTLRFADGPDEVHRNQIAKLEIGEQTTVTEALAKRTHR